VYTDVKIKQKQRVVERRYKMRKADMATFKNYLYYYLEIPMRKIEGLDEDGFNLLKNYFFKTKEGYELDADYEEFMEYIKDLDYERRRTENKKAIAKMF
jgi:hypothetical protein